MSAGSGGRSKLAAKAVLVVSVGLLLGGCSALSLFKSHKGEPGANEPYPNLGSVPDRPEEKESAADRKELAEGLVADRTKVQYTDQALRGGTEASAPPPPPPVTELRDATSVESTGATSASKGELQDEERPGFFGRLLGKNKNKVAKATAETPESQPPAVDTQPAAEAPQLAPEESAGSAEMRKDESTETKRGFFRRIFGSKKSEETNLEGTAAVPAPSAAEEQPAAEASPIVAPEESTGATEFQKDESQESKPGLFRRLFGSKKNKESSDPSGDAQPALADPAAAPSASPTAAQ